MLLQYLYWEFSLTFVSKTAFTTIGISTKSSKKHTERVIPDSQHNYQPSGSCLKCASLNFFYYEQCVKRYPNLLKHRSNTLGTKNCHEIKFQPDSRPKFQNVKTENWQ